MSVTENTFIGLSEILLPASTVVVVRGKLKLKDDFTFHVMLSCLDIDRIDSPGKRQGL